MAENVTAPIAEMDLISGKPACGSGQEPGEYDLGLHVAALFMVLAASIFGAGFPVVAKKVKWVKVPAKTFFICKHFGTGVLVATAFVHLLPTAFGNLTDPCLPDLFTDKYPAMPGVIMMGSMFCLFIIEIHLPAAPAPAPANRAPPSRPPRYTSASDFEIEDIDYEKKLAQKMYDEKMRDAKPTNPYANVNDTDTGYPTAPSEMPPWFVVFYEQYVRQRLEMINMIKSMNHHQHDTDASTKRQTVITTTTPASLADSPYIDEETGQAVDPAVFRKMSMNITLLEGGILFHSVFVGMTVSITVDGFLVLLIAIMFHQMFEGLGLGSRIAAVPYPRGSIRPWLLVVAFGTTAPIGQAIGLAVKDSYDPNSAFGLIIVGVFNAISSGLLLYAALVDLLAEDFLSEEANRTLTKKDRITAFAFVILGAIGMSIVGAFA
ncbi:hypothetical protein NEMBOFW57_008876 [Staphylotrichum longicolle]|uniref:Uncharacterized protein n=1 Tax=Staphylotrichum longicolle TaxID=669026 RepID=A0AAD4ESU2_9PEZI|nr:hypothetical protein NEMBOFW57_008876 [Staphylotrichum longicolle]